MTFKEFLRWIFEWRLVILRKGEVDKLADIEQRKYQSTARMLTQAVYMHGEVERQRVLFARLTRREQDVVALSCLGYRNEEIAVGMGIALTTVVTHLRNAKMKLGVRGKGELRVVFGGLDFRGWDDEHQQ